MFNSFDGEILTSKKNIPANTLISGSCGDNSGRKIKNVSLIAIQKINNSVITTRGLSDENGSFSLNIAGDMPVDIACYHDNYKPQILKGLSVKDPVEIKLTRAR